MTVAKLTIIALSAAAIMFSGCSTDNRLTGPGVDNNPEIDNKLDGLIPVTLNPNSAVRVAVGDNDSDQKPERITIVAKVVMLDVENGCWYLFSNDGETYTPVTPKELVLENGLSLKAEGYVDKEIQFFCGNGPAFVIENYEILERPKDSDEDRYSGIKSGSDFSEDRAPSQPIDDRYQQELIEKSIEAKKKIEEERRSELLDDKKSAPAMNDNDRYSDRDQKERESEEAKKKIEEEKRGSDYSSDKSAPTMDDNDRYSDQDLMDRDLEEAKKKGEEEERPKDKDNDRP